MHKRIPSLVGEAYPEYGLGSVTVSVAMRHEAHIWGVHLIKSIPMALAVVLLGDFPALR